MRLQLALNVIDLDESIDFYSQLFGEGPSKLKEGYANWSLSEPPLKLVLFERGGREEGDSGHDVNHLGIEVDSADEVIEIEARLSARGLETTGVEDTICCFAGKTETWVVDPDGHRWEVYVKTSDHETQLENVVISSPAPPCCA
jgi:catechol 2,3-dioxygenase-like lactoylglutathione lyase family enzyme